jgi:predicted transcriptional regulator
MTNPARKPNISTSSRGRWKSDSDRDPVISHLQQAIEESGMKPAEVAAKAMCSYQTVQRIVDGETRLPRNSTAERIFEACGIARSYTRNGKVWQPR